MKYISLLLFALFTTSGSAQLLYDNFEAATSGTLFQNKVGRTAPKSAVEGSPYQQETFLPAQISGVKGLVLSRYDMSTDQIEVKISAEEADVYVLPKKPEYGRIIFSGNKYALVLASYVNSDGERSTGYLVRVHEAKNIGLYRQDKATFKKGKIAESNYDIARPDSWEKQSPKYFMTTADGSIIAMPRSAKELTAIYPADKSDAIRAFLKTNGYSFKKEGDLIQIVSFLSTL